MRQLRFVLFLCPLALIGCASTDSSPSGNVDANGDQVSSVPWNKPESWETGGELGSQMGNSR